MNKAQRERHNYPTRPFHGPELERARSEDLFKLLPSGCRSALDIGAKDGFFSLELAKRYENVTALDLERPHIDSDCIKCVQGDVTKLGFSDGEFDLVFCTEVLEHISPPTLQEACNEIQRVSGRYVLIGVPYKQDTRCGRTICQSCRFINPPWGHVNQFDEDYLFELFSNLRPITISFVGKSAEQTNWLATTLNYAGGNPYGTYEQDEHCINCGQNVGPPPAIRFRQKIFNRLAKLADAFSNPFRKERPNWIHILFEKKSPG